VKMTDSEKLILIMLSDLYTRTGTKGDIDPEFIKSSIYSNQTWALSWKFSGIPFENTETPPLVKKVIDILDMWSFILVSYEQLPSKDKVYLAENLKHFGKKPEFKGFDGNNETEYLSTATFIINELDRFVEFKNQDLNSHMPSVPIYERMLPVFEAERKKRMFELLSAEQLVTVLSEQIHPDNRK